MPSLLLIIFVLQVLVHLANNYGASAINDLLWSLYNRFPTSTSRDFTRQRALRSELIRLKKELNATSAQDEFAKWAKIQRQHDKASEEHEKLSNSLSSTRTSFNKYVGTLRWVSTNGGIFFLQFWHGKKPMFWIGQYKVPYPVKWILSFPRAPLGSVSIQIWSMACKTVVKIGDGFVQRARGVKGEEKHTSGEKREKVAMPAGGGGGGDKETKKEL